MNAIAREKEVKMLLREKKDALIESMNPERRFLNSEVFGHWPPTEADILSLQEFLRKNPGERER